MSDVLKLKIVKIRKYSPSEQLLFELMPTEERSAISSTALTKRYIEKRKKLAKKLGKKFIEPKYPQEVVNGSLQTLIEKAKHNQEPFIIHHSGKNGPHPSWLWIEHRRSSKVA